VLGHYVRELGLLTLPEAVYKMTGLPARRFGLRERGLVADGCAADLVVFDPDMVADGATYDRPLTPPRGIRLVVVAGQVVVDDGEVSAATPGRVLSIGPGRTVEGRR
jgi:N-acyl-D-aspartate/D-glutamate deacylase